MKTDHEDLCDDMLSGAEAIARFYGWKLRRTYYLLEQGAIPCFKVGKIWHARRSTSTANIEKLESMASNARAV